MPSKSKEPATSPQENSIRRGGALSREPIEPDKQTPRAQSGPPKPINQAPDSQAVPDHIKDRYIQIGNKYHFPNGDPAFHDRGARLTTKSENTEVIRDLVAIAHERGWNTVTVSGTERFRKEAWQQAQLAGLAVRGYRPTELERAQLARLIDRERTTANLPRGAGPTDREFDPVTQSHTRPEAPPPVPPVEERIYRGILLDHGRANYQHDAHADVSYFVKIDTPAGERTLWGKDLERALQESLSQVKPGDEVAVRHLGEKPVTVIRPTRDAQGVVTGRAEVATYRNRWLIESQEFLSRRAEIARMVRDPTADPKEVTHQRPELVGTYLELRAAELVAKEVYADRRDRERFVARVRDAIAEEIERGQPLSAVRIRQPAKTRDRARTLDRTHDRVLN